MGVACDTATNSIFSNISGFAVYVCYLVYTPLLILIMIVVIMIVVDTKVALVYKTTSELRTPLI